MQNRKDMKDFVIGLLRDNLPENYLYHNPEHTLYVIDKAMEIGRQEKCTVEELEFISVAALWHDTGYTKTYTNHEAQSCILARHYLPEFGYTYEYIERICDMIMVTKIPQLPKNKLEEILADADLEYLGTEEFEIKSDCLFKELQSVKLTYTEAEWNQAQISFLQEHHYFTPYCQETKQPIKTEHLLKLKAGLG
ncbi:MAG: HD domain-containing protein [Bacteroidota bacterium]